MPNSSELAARVTPRKSALEIARSTGRVQLCDGHEERQRARGLAREGFNGTHMPELQDWFKERIETTTSKRKSQNASSYTMGHCIYKCEVYREFGECLLTQNLDNGFVVAQCGRVHTQVCAEGAEKRFFQDDYEKSMANVRAEEDMSAAGKELVSIEGCEIGRPELDDAAIAAGEDEEDEEDETGWDVVKKANGRLNQVTVWFKCMQDETPGSFFLTPGEVLTARRALRAVCVRWARRGCDVANSSSPVFWAIGIALEMVARRRDGFTVPDAHMQSLTTVEGLWRYLEPRKSDAFWTDESDFNKTRAWIHTRTQMSMRDAVRATQQAKRRQARLDALGSPMAQSQKLACLSQLLGQSGFFKGTERTTLHPSILSLRAPDVRAPPPFQAATTNLGVKWAMERASFGLNAITKPPPRNSLPASASASASATASDTSSDFGDDEAEDDEDQDMAEAEPAPQPQPEPMAIDAEAEAEAPAAPAPAEEAAEASDDEGEEEEDDDFDSGDEADEAAVRDLGTVSDDTDSEDEESDFQRAFREDVDAEAEAPDELTCDRKRRNYDRSEWAKLSKREALTSANFDRNPKWIKEWRAAVDAAKLQTAAVDAERQAKLDRRKERRMRRQRRAIEARLIEQARQEDAPLIAAARAKRRADHKAQKRAERAERKQRREQEASKNRAERRVEAASSSNAVALSVAANADMADEVTGHIPVLKLQVARAASDGTVTHTNATFDEAKVVSHRAAVGNRVADKLLPGARGIGKFKHRRVGLTMKGVQAYSLSLHGNDCIARRHLDMWT